MPTGYTAALYDGPQEFKDFVRSAARGMGAFIHLRDASADVPLTYPEPDTYRLMNFKESFRKNARWKRMTEEEKYAEWSEYVQRVTEYNERDNSEFYERRARFDEMIAKVEATEVPPQLQSFKDFMLQQLGTEFQYSREPWRQEIMDFYEWCEHEDEYRARRVKNDREYYRNAVERYHETVEYIDLLGETFGFEVEKPE